jgi:hypothetical protein
MSREVMIEALVEDDLDSIFYQDEYFSDTKYIHNILYSGFKGYENYTNEELEAECRERGLYDDEENLDIELEQ